MGKYLSSLNCYVNCIDDFEPLIGMDGIEAINYIVEKEKDDISFNKWKKHNDDYEQIADNYYQQINSSIKLLDNVTSYVMDSKRIDRKKLLSLLEEVVNQLENY